MVDDEQQEDYLRERRLVGAEVVDVEDEFLGQIFGRSPDDPADARIYETILDVDSSLAHLSHLSHLSSLIIRPFVPISPRLHPNPLETKPRVQTKEISNIPYVPKH